MNKEFKTKLIETDFKHKFYKNKAVLKELKKICKDENVHIPIICNVVGNEKRIIGEITKAKIVSSANQIYVDVSSLIHHSIIIEGYIDYDKIIDKYCGVNSLVFKKFTYDEFDHIVMTCDIDSGIDVSYKFYLNDFMKTVNIYTPQLGWRPIFGIHCTSTIEESYKKIHDYVLNNFIDSKVYLFMNIIVLFQTDDYVYPTDIPYDDMKELFKGADYLDSIF